MKTKYRFIHFSPTILDGIWNCVNNRHQTVLGVVSYYKPWKQYVFNAEDPADIFSQDCLEDIIDFMKQLNKEPINGKAKVQQESI